MFSCKKTSSAVNTLVATQGTTAEYAQTLLNLSEPINGVGEARLQLYHGQHDRTCPHTLLGSSMLPETTKMLLLLCIRPDNWVAPL